MHQLLHLLIVDRDGRAALADTHGTKWLLPMVSADERTRALSPVQQWIERRGVGGDLIGQWLGRLPTNAGAIDWLVVYRASDRASHTLFQPWSWIPLVSLRSSASVFDYQQWAVANATADRQAPEVAGPFGALTWPDRINTWIEEAAGAALTGPATIYRASPHEVVAAFSIDDARMYFKGLAPDRASEARLTMTLSAAFPEKFARTCSLAPLSDGSAWWLAKECAGLPLTQDVAPEWAARVAAACAHVQKRVVGSTRIEAELVRLDLTGTAEWAVELLGRLDHADDMDRSRDAIVRAFDDVRGVDMPCGWVPLDLDPSNVLVDGGGAVRFIDLDDSYWGPTALAPATFARRLRRLIAGTHGEADPISGMYRAFEQGWSWPPLGARQWRAYEIVSSVLEARLGWQRVLANAARGEVHGPLDIVVERLARRVARAISAPAHDSPAP